MNRNDFLNMMNDSAPVDRQMIGDLYELIDIFPYFQSAHLLLLKGLQNTSDVKFETQLRNSAIHIADREILYNNLKFQVPDAGHAVVLNPEQNFVDEAGTDNQQNVIESAKNSDELINEIDLLELETDSGSEDFLDFYPAEEDISHTDKEVSSKQIQADLIDKFIIANPRIEPNRDKTNLPVEDISKPFVEQDGGFVTETLAKIYISQGYYSKAIDIYEKLSLKFPEKSSYFASQIEKVKEYIKK